MTGDKQAQRRLVLAGERETEGRDVDFVSAIKVLGRHWIAVTTGLLAIVIACGAILVVVPATYEVKASDVLLVPAQVGSSQAGQANPYLGFGGSLGIVAEITARRMNDQSTAEQIKKLGATADYLVDIVPGDAPLLQVTADSQHRDEALRTAVIVEKYMTSNLATTQLDLRAPKNLLITTSPVTRPTQAEVQRGSQLRAIAGTFVVGLALTVLAAFLMESIQTRRRKRGESDDDAVDSVDAVEVVDVKPAKKRDRLDELEELSELDDVADPVAEPVTVRRRAGYRRVSGTVTAPGLVRRGGPSEETQRLRPVVRESTNGSKNGHDIRDVHEGETGWKRTNGEVAARPARRD